MKWLAEDVGYAPIWEWGPGAWAVAGLWALALVIVVAFVSHGQSKRRP